MKYFLLFVILLISYHCGFSQQAVINGQITDSQTNLPISNAQINLYSLSKGGTNYEVKTDIGGYFTISNVSSAHYWIEFSHDGYKTGTANIDANSSSIININLKMNTSEISTGEINVNSTRYETKLKNIPMPMEIVSDDELSRRTYQTLSDALDNKPGLSIVRDGIWASDISIRGLSRANIVMNIDGNRVETANDLAARMSLVDINDVDRVEVIKGGVSALYGTGALGGVVNVYTKNGDFSNKFLYGATLIGGYNTVNKSPNTWASVFTSSKDFFIKVNGSYKDAQNTNTPKGELLNSQFNDFNINANAGYKFFKKAEIRLSYQKYKALNIGLPGGGTLFPVNAFVRYPVESRDMASVEFRLNNISSPMKHFSVKYFYQTILRDVENLPGTMQVVKTPSGKVKQKVSVLSITPTGRHYINGLQFKADWVLGKYNYLISGVDIWMRALDSRRERNQMIQMIDTTTGNVTNTIYKTIGEKPIPDADYRSIGAYVQDEIKLFNDKLKLNIGGRADQIHITNSIAYQPKYEITNGVRNDNPAGQKIIWSPREANDISWSANLGAIYTLTKNYDITFNLSRSFRSPTLEERYQYIDLGSKIRLGNADLSPERGIFGDLGFRVWRDNFTFSGNVFYNYFDDLVSEIPGTYENRPADIKTNIGEARLYGYEMNVMYNVYRSLIGYGSLSFVRGENITDGTNLPLIPPLNVTIGVKFAFRNIVNFDIYSNIFNKQENSAPGEMDTPGYAVFNASLSSSPVNLKYITLQLFAGVENIFDKEYRSHLSSNRGLIVVEAGRNIFFKLKMDL